MFERMNREEREESPTKFQGFFPILSTNLFLSAFFFSFLFPAFNALLFAYLGPKCDCESFLRYSTHLYTLFLDLGECW